MEPVRVLHVVGQMKRAGVETWLMHLLRAADRSRLQMEFLVNAPGEGHYDREIRALGSAIHHAGPQATPLRFARRLRAILREGRHHAVHSHVHFFSGFVLGVARRAGVPVRIAHSHLDSREEDGRAPWSRRLYLSAMRRAIQRHATHGIGVSDVAGAALFGPGWRNDPRWSILHCALDFSEFGGASDRAAARRELGLPREALAAIHVGRFEEQKNHRFLLEIAAEVMRRERRAFLVLVGDGKLRPAVEKAAARLGIRDRVILAGVRPDVARLLRACDLFLLPSLREGLPLVGLEAQAAGLPVVLSDTVTRELAVVPGLLRWHSLSDPASAWAGTVVEALHAPRVPAVEALAALERSDFNLQRSLHLLEEIYGVAPLHGSHASARTA